MANINDAQRVRFEQGGSLTITLSATDYVVVGIVAGSLTWKDGLQERQVDYEKDAMTTTVRPGNERPSEINFDVFITSETYDSSELLALLQGSFTTGALGLYDIAVKIPDYRSGGGKVLTWTGCWVPEGLSGQTAGAGSDPDKLQVRILSKTTAAARTDYT